MYIVQQLNAENYTINFVENFVQILEITLKTLKLNL